MKIKHPILLSLVSLQASLSLHAGSIDAVQASDWSLPSRVLNKERMEEARFAFLSRIKTFAERLEPEVFSFIQSIKNVQIKVNRFNDELLKGLQAQMETVRLKLQEEHWERILYFEEAHEIAELYLRSRDGRMVETLMVLLTENGSETYLVNIAGDLTPEQIEQIGKKFQIPLMELIKKNSGLNAS